MPLVENVSKPRRIEVGTTRHFEDCIADAAFPTRIVAFCTPLPPKASLAHEEVVSAEQFSVSRRIA